MLSKLVLCPFFNVPVKEKPLLYYTPIRVIRVIWSFIFELLQTKQDFFWLSFNSHFLDLILQDAKYKFTHA